MSEGEANLRTNLEMLDSLARDALRRALMTDSLPRSGCRRTPSSSTEARRTGALTPHLSHQLSHVRVSSIEPGAQRRSSQPSSQAFSGRMLGEHWDVAQDVRPATQAHRRFLKTFGHLLG